MTLFEKVRGKFRLQMKKLWFVVEPAFTPCRVGQWHALRLKPRHVDARKPYMSMA